MGLGLGGDRLLEVFAEGRLEIACGMENQRKCEGHTRVVNLHGALIHTAIPLRVGMRIEILVAVPNARASATVLQPNRWCRKDWPLA